MADNYTFKDAGGNTITHASADVGSGVHVSRHVAVDSTGTEIYYKGSAVLASAISVTTSATPLPTSALAARRALLVYNNGSVTVYLGPSGVTTSNGYPLLPGQSMVLEAGALAIYGRVAAGTAEVRILEVA